MSRADREAAHERAMLQGRHLETAIRERMPAAGVRSISELARRSGVQRDTLYAWFRGHPPKPVTLQRIRATRPGRGGPDGPQTWPSLVG